MVHDQVNWGSKMDLNDAAIWKAGTVFIEARFRVNVDMDVEASEVFGWYSPDVYLLNCAVTEKQPRGTFVWPIADIRFGRRSFGGSVSYVDISLY